MAGNGTRGGHVEEGQRRLAVLIDADNAQASVIEGLLAEVARFGVASVKRIYGDFTSTRLQAWKQVLLEHSIQPVQQFAYTTGKNATDSSLIIDAMDLMHTRRFDGFCLVSSDSDFTRLAQRLREEGLTVYGFGEKKTPAAFRQACDTFIHTEVLRPVQPAPKAKPPTKKSASSAAPPAAVAKPEKAPLPLLRNAVEQSSGDGKWAHLGAVGSYINKVQPDFDPRLFGCKKLSDLLRAYPAQFDLQERGEGPAKSVHVRLIE